VYKFDTCRGDPIGVHFMSRATVSVAPQPIMSS
jgi:hypothetical protein